MHADSWRGDKVISNSRSINITGVYREESLLTSSSVLFTCSTSYTITNSIMYNLF